MGYTTDFEGHFTLSRPATEEERDYINNLSNTRRMKRDVNILQKLHSGKYGFNGDYGIDGEYFVGGGMGQDNDESVIDHNIPPGQIEYSSTDDFNVAWDENKKRIVNGLCQPGLWCQWTISEDGTKLEWDGSEKFYYYEEWLRYLVEHFFNVWDIKLNGEILYQGEDATDSGNLLMLNNKLYSDINIKEIRKMKLDSIDS